MPKPNNDDDGFSRESARELLSRLKDFGERNGNIGELDQEIERLEALLADRTVKNLQDRIEALQERTLSRVRTVLNSQPLESNSWDQWGDWNIETWGDWDYDG